MAKRIAIVTGESKRQLAVDASKRAAAKLAAIKNATAAQKLARLLEYIEDLEARISALEQK